MCTASLNNSKLPINKNKLEEAYQNPINDSAILSILQRAAREEIVPPLELEIHPSNLCNKCCRRCIGLTSKSVSKEMLSKEIMFSILDQAANYHKNEFSIKQIKFSGYTGEPLLNPFTLLAIEKALSLNFKVGIITNGTLLDKNACKILIEATYVFISLDYADEKTFASMTGTKENVYGTIIKNIRQLVALRKQKKSNLKINLGFVLQAETYKEVQKMIEVAKNLEVDSVRFKIEPSDVPAGKTVLAENDLRTIYNRVTELKNKYSNENFSILCAPPLKHPTFTRCFAQFALAIIDPKGDIYPCGHYGYGRQRGSFGNIYNLSLQEIWEKKEREQYLKKNGIPHEQCLTCPTYAYKINDLARSSFL